MNMGWFTPLEALRNAMEQVGCGNSFFAAPTIVMHPLAMVEGGLAPVEHRVFMEVADCAGAKQVTVWVGDELSDREVQEKARAAQLNG